MAPDNQTTQALNKWLAAYVESVGPAADFCVTLFSELIQSKALTMQGQQQMLELSG